MKGYAPGLGLAVVTGVGEGNGDQVDQILTVSFMHKDGQHYLGCDEGAYVFGGDVGEVYRVSAQDQSAGAVYVEVEEDALEGGFHTYLKAVITNIQNCMFVC